MGEKLTRNDSSGNLLAGGLEGAMDGPSRGAGGQQATSWTARAKVRNIIFSQP